MNSYSIASLILSLTVVITFINYRFIRMPSAIALMIAALSISLLAILFKQTTPIHALLIRTNFQALVINGLLSFLLFAGAMHIDLSILKSEKWEIATLSSISTIASTLIIGFLLYYLLPLLNSSIQLPLLFCLLFGALISPTDPIAVLAIVKKIKAPKRLETIISGESLFNDGVGIVLFVTLYSLTIDHVPMTVMPVLTLLSKQVLGGIGFGMILGYLITLLLKQCRETHMMMLLTIGSVAGAYAFALNIGISGPLAIVVMGIFVGNTLHQQLILFWDIIDELLNAVLFLLIGFELLAVHMHSVQFIASIAVIFIVLAVRFITVAIPIKLLCLKRPQLPYTISLLTWGGLRGGLAVALALSLPESAYREFILAMTYAVVAFSIIVQGLTVGKLAKKAMISSK